LAKLSTAYVKLIETAAQTFSFYLQRQKSTVSHHEILTAYCLLVSCSFFFSLHHFGRQTMSFDLSALQAERKNDDRV
jgi:hypothetical protein